MPIAAIRAIVILRPNGYSLAIMKLMSASQTHDIVPESSSISDNYISA
jgi:hypothetical protein